MTTWQVLEKAAALVAEGWCQHAWARNATGETVYVWSEATHVCLMGAIWKASNLVDSRYLPDGPSCEALRLVAQVIGTHSLGVWNDDPGRTQSEVVAVLRSAARRAVGGWRWTSRVT